MQMFNSLPYFFLYAAFSSLSGLQQHVIFGSFKIGLSAFVDALLAPPAIGVVRPGPSVKTLFLRAIKTQKQTKKQRD